MTVSTLALPAVRTAQKGCKHKLAINFDALPTYFFDALPRLTPMCRARRWPLRLQHTLPRAPIAASHHPVYTIYLDHVQGPALAIDTACSSSLVAAHVAAGAMAVRVNKPCTAGLAAGVNLPMNW